jgi:hypothetical protein
MATRRFQFFMRLDELVKVVQEIGSELGLHFILYSFEFTPRLKYIGKVLDKDELSASKPYWIYLSLKKPTPEQLALKDPNAQEHGWVEIDFPKEEGKVLYKAVLGVKSDWLDDNDNQRDNPEVIKLFDRFKRKFKKHFKSGIWLDDYIEPGNPSFYPNIWYSESAKAFQEKGGELQQWGAKNNRYFVVAPGKPRNFKKAVTRFN